MEQSLEKKTIGLISFTLEEATIKVKAVSSLFTLLCLSCQDENAQITLSDYFELFTSFAGTTKSIISDLEKCDRGIEELKSAEKYVSSEDISKFSDKLGKRKG